jgi:hypothetical protein
MISTIFGMKSNLLTQYSLLIQHLVTCIRSINRTDIEILFDFTGVLDVENH